MATILIPAENNQSFSAYMALPAVLPAPGIVLIQEIFGVNAGMRQIADSLAKEGFVVFCPDLFWRQEPNIELTDQSEAEWQKAFTLLTNFNLEAGIADLKRTHDVLKHHAACTGKVGNLGFCLGGKLAYLMACRTDTDASVSYYGVQIDEMLTEATHIKKPLLLHIAEKDGFVSPEAQQAIKNGLKNNPLATIHSYADVDHGFARTAGKNYQQQAAALANERSLAFLRQNLL